MNNHLGAAAECSITNPLGCVGEAAGVPGAVANTVVGSAWESVCRSFADAAVAMLEFFATAFVDMPAVDLQSGGVRDVYAISLALAGTVAAILLLIQAARTALTHDGAALAHALVGLGKAGLAFLLTVTVAGTALIAADEISAFIINRTFGNAEGLRKKLTGLFVAPNVAPSLLLLLALVCILLVVVLWFELLLRNAAVVALIATSPIAAAGQIGEATKTWWPRLVSATLQLIVLKPVIALVFALGLNVTGSSDDIATILSGLVVLLLAALAWPAIARFFTFASVQMGGGMGLAGILGVGSNLANSGNGMPVGADPNQFSQTTEARTMGAHTGRATTAGTLGATRAGGAAGGAAAATGGAAAVVFAAKFALDAAQKGANALVGSSEQMAGHAGLDGANPYANPAGYPRHATPQWHGRSADSPPQPAHDGGVAAGDFDPPPAPQPAAVSPVRHERPPPARVVDERGGG